ncbi:MAG TPA: FecR family protein, partial [Candidatus Competibacteraceae bacterium]|nr:FecR family protein [Candidatus Competibacteraceae bacterium]
MELRKPVLLQLLFVCALLSASAQAQDSCEPWVARIESAEGRVEAKRSGQTTWQAVRLGDAFCYGDSIRVEDNSRAAVLLAPDQTLLRLDQKTTITLTAPEPAAQASWLDLLRGAVHFISRTPQPLKIKTPYVNAAVEGTEFLLRVEPSRTALWVYEGRVLASNEHGELRLGGGEAALTEAGQAPRKRL